PDPGACSDQPRPTPGRGESALRSCGAAVYAAPQLWSTDIPRPPCGPAASAVPCGPAASAVRRRASRVCGQAEALVAAGVLGGGGGAGRDPVAIAVGVVAQVGAAAHDPHIAGHRGGRPGGPGIGAPFPHVAGHLVQSQAVGWERADRGSAEKAILPGVAQREGTLPDVAPVLSVRGELIAPGVAGLVQPAPG